MLLPRGGSHNQGSQPSITSVFNHQANIRGPQSSRVGSWPHLSSASWPWLSCDQIYDQIGSSCIRPDPLQVTGCWDFCLQAMPGRAHNCSYVWKWHIWAFTYLRPLGLQSKCTNRWHHKLQVIYSPRQQPGPRLVISSTTQLYTVLTARRLPQLQQP